MSLEYEKTRRKPHWLKIKLHNNPQYAATAAIVGEHHLHTICQSGRCPNISECWSRGTATFMILGEICTRSCKFCATATGRPLPPDANEPVKLARSVRVMGLRHAVVTSVDRDDLPDGGAAHWVAAVEAMRRECPQTTIELLIPDFDGRTELLDRVIDSGAHVIGHNIETVEALTPAVRSRANYRTSLEVLRYIADRGARMGNDTLAKSGLMVGLGETEGQVLQTIDDLATVGVRRLTIGQYLQPTPKHHPVAEYIHPDQFEKYRTEAIKRGIIHVESGPLVRSSYMADREAPKMETLERERTPQADPVEAIRLIDCGVIDYAQAWSQQQSHFDRLLSDPTAGGVLMMCEHPHVYTLGRNGKEANMLISPETLERIGATYYHIDRGGDVTYHGYGQVVGYPIINLQRVGISLKEYIYIIEECVIRTLAHWDIRAARLEGAAGVWIDGNRKICAIGVRASRYVTMHGWALNVNTDLAYFNHINPCGFVDKGVTSMDRELGREVDFERVKSILAEEFMRLIAHGNER